MKTLSLVDSARTTQIDSAAIIISSVHRFLLPCIKLLMMITAESKHSKRPLTITTIAVLHTYLCFCSCVTNCDLSADIHCVFWAACTLHRQSDIVTALSPAFITGEQVGQRGFLQLLVPGIVTNYK